MASKLIKEERSDIIVFVRRILKEHGCTYACVFSENRRMKFYSVFGRHNVRYFEDRILNSIQKYLDEHIWLSGTPTAMLYPKLTEEQKAKGKLFNSIAIYFKNPIKEEHDQGGLNG